MSENFYLRCDEHADESGVALRNAGSDWLPKLEEARPALAALRKTDLRHGGLSIDCLQVDDIFLSRHQTCVLRLRSEYERYDPPSPGTD